MTIPERGNPEGYARRGGLPGSHGSLSITDSLDATGRKPRARNSLPHQFGFCALRAQNPAGRLFDPDDGLRREEGQEGSQGLLDVLRAL